ncbi:MAG: chemotaxis protein CheV [Nitrospinae bacterium]|nr:chemotaxis protein CheV [Nitrospinota bacterium]
MAQTGILLESGTNELEIVEFQINQKDEKGELRQGFYGVNVAKVREIIKCPERFAEVPRTNPTIVGVINLRGRIIPIIDLPKWLNKADPDNRGDRVIITEFNTVVTGFLVHSVARIHRLSWEKVESPSGLMNQAERECVTGIVKFDEKILMLLDFERIVAEMNPEVSFDKTTIRKSASRSGKTVFIAEDSNFIRKKIVELLKQAGYRVFSASNGVEALKKLSNIAEDAERRKLPINRYVNLIVTDVEMPQMDGLHLLTKLKAIKQLRDVPIVVFSSMVSKENRVKWASLGAVDFITKPEIERLVTLVDTKSI